MRTAVKFLLLLFKNSIVDVANISVAEGENDKDTIKRYLISVKEYIDELIKGVDGS